MNRQLFLQLLEHPDSVSEHESIALQKFTEDFPYCQTGQLLFVKHLHSQQSVHYPEQLKIAAAYAADRKVIYNLIHAPTKEVEVAQEQLHQPKSVSLIEEQIEESPAPTPDEIITEKKIVAEPASQADIIQKRLQEIETSKALSVAPIQRKEESVSTKSSVEALPKPETVSVKEAIVVSPKESIHKEIPPEKKEDLKSGKHSFTEWLKTVKKEPVIQSKEEATKSAASTDEIINRFIETEPRIVPSKAEFYNPIKMAKQSLEEHDDLVSETLAGIFAEQGNLPRAIEMYRKLMLSIPEKSSFFAARIEKLSQQLNEGK